MDTLDTSNLRGSASEAILQVQREVLLKLGAELLDSQRVAIAGVQAEMERTSQELSERMTAWRRQTIGAIRFSTGLLVPWLVLLALLGIATLALGAKARDAWADYRAAAAAAERLRVHGALTVVKDGKLYVRVDPDSLAQGRQGNWYARALSVELREEPAAAKP
jgi:hypothetical protein